MIGLLRFLGIVNAAIWLGAAVFFSFVAGSAPFSADMKEALGEPARTVNPYFYGAIAQVMVKRYFLLHYVCGAVAVLQLLGEWLYLGRPLKSLKSILLTVVLIAGLAGGLWLQPKLKELHHMKYYAPPTQAQQAAKDFRLWHGLSRVGDLFALIALLAYFWQTLNPSDATRFASVTKFRR